MIENSNKDRLLVEPHEAQPCSAVVPLCQEARTQHWPQGATLAELQCCFTSTETTRTIRDRGHLHFDTVQVQCCFTSTETIRTIIRDGGTQDGHLNFHTAPEL